MGMQVFTRVRILGALVAAGLVAGLSGTGLAATSATTSATTSVAPPVAPSPVIGQERIFAAFSDSVVEIDPATGAAKVVPDHLKLLQQGPYLLVATPDGKSVYLVNSGADEVVPFSAATGQPGAPIHVAGAQVAAMAPDGTLYVGGHGVVTPISTASGKAGRAVNADGDPGSMAVTPDGRTLYVADSDTGVVLPISTATDRPGRPIHVESKDAGVVNGAGIAISPDGKTLWVLTNSGATPVSTASGTTGTPMEVSGTPVAIAITPSGRTAYVVRNGNTFAAVSPLDLVTHTVGKSIPVPGLAEWVTISPSGQTAYVGYLGGPVIPINTATNVKGPYFGWSQLTMAVAFGPSPATVYTCGWRGVIPASTTTDTLGATLYDPPLSNLPAGPCSAIVVTP
jgi:DNA-binding beta-propeller fold protein YncE